MILMNRAKSTKKESAFYFTYETYASNIIVKATLHGLILHTKASFGCSSFILGKERFLAHIQWIRVFHSIQEILFPAAVSGEWNRGILEPEWLNRALIHFILAQTEHLFFYFTLFHSRPLDFNRFALRSDPKRRNQTRPKSNWIAGHALTGPRTLFPHYFLPHRPYCLCLLFCGHCRPPLIVGSYIYCFSDFQDCSDCSGMSQLQPLIIPLVSSRFSSSIKNISI